MHMQTPAKANLVRIWSLHWPPDDFQNLIGTSLSKDVFMINFHADAISFSRGMSQLWKMPYLVMLKNPLKNS